MKGHESLLIETPFDTVCLTEYFNALDIFQVEFQICECRKNNTKTAAYVRILATQPVVKESPVQEQGVTRQRSVPEVAVKEQVCKEQGFLAILKENCGFIEMADHEKEVFFQFKLVNYSQLITDLILH